ncbi:olfactory receptor 5P64-like [Ascaphus truei]|uniref:olfactory receptor 5P64-like n=1 Tax=Ascaphus truei TaxID=8439 RepID=UPI003F593175
MVGADGYPRDEQCLRLALIETDGFSFKDGPKTQEVMDKHNQSRVTEFLLLGMTGSPFGVRIFLYVLFLVTYISTLIGNLLIIVLISTISQLHSPMYLFLRNLSVCELLLTTVIVPLLLHVLLAEKSLISVSGCLFQFYVMSAALATECLLLSVISYDRYLAFCNPLRYFSLMNHKLCHQLGFLCWLSAYVIAVMTIVPICTLQFCGPNIMDHFFCDLFPLLELSCSDTRTVVIDILMPSATSRQKAFSNCSSHLASVAMYYGTLVIMYVVPSKGYSFNANKFLSLLYSVATLLLNPIIYSLRNQEIRVALKKMLCGMKQWANI